MGSSVNIKHIITNRKKLLGVRFAEELFNNMLTLNTLQSNVHYEITEKYLKIEYFSKYIPLFIFENPIIKFEDILTIDSNDQGNRDILFVFNSEWDGNFNHEDCFYEFDQFEVTGDREEIHIFQQYLYHSNDSFEITDRWVKKTSGRLILHATNQKLANEYTSYVDRYSRFRLIEDHKEYEPILLNESCWISSFTCEDDTLNQRLERILQEMFYHPELYHLKIESVRFSRHNHTIFLAKFNTEKSEWEFFHNDDLWSMLSNPKLATTLNEIGYKVVPA